MMTVDGEMVNRCEIFDEADLDAAIARFEELSQPTPRLENSCNACAGARVFVHCGQRLGRRGSNN